MCRQNEERQLLLGPISPNPRVPLRQPKFGCSCISWCLKSSAHHTRTWGVEYGSYCSLYGEGTWATWCYMVWKMVGASITGYRVVYEQKHGWKWCKRGRGRVWRLSNAHIYGILVSITLGLISTGQIQP